MTEIKDNLGNTSIGKVTKEKQFNDNAGRIKCAWLSFQKRK